VQSCTHTNLSGSTRECVHLVSGSYCPSRKKDGDHAIRSAAGENRMLHAHFTAVTLCTDAELLATEFLTCAHATYCGPFSVLRSFTSRPDPMTSIWTWPYCLGLYRMCKYELPTSSLAFDSFCLTHIHTYLYITTDRQNRPKL